MQNNMLVSQLRACAISAQMGFPCRLGGGGGGAKPAAKRLDSAPSVFVRASDAYASEQVRRCSHDRGSSINGFPGLSMSHQGARAGECASGGGAQLVRSSLCTLPAATNNHIFIVSRSGSSSVGAQHRKEEGARRELAKSRPAAAAAAAKLCALASLS